MSQYNKLKNDVKKFQIEKMSSHQQYPGWRDPAFIKCMEDCDRDVSHHNQWWVGKNNGMSKSWVIQDGHSKEHTRYKETDGAPWSFVFQCKESSLPQEALDVVYLFSPHSMLNLRGAVVPTTQLVPRLDGGGGGSGGGGGTMAGKQWKVVGIWKKNEITKETDNIDKNNHNDNDDHDDHDVEEGDEDEDDDDEDENIMYMGAGSNRNSSTGNRSVINIHDMDLDSGMPLLSGNASGMDLQNINPVTVEAWFPKVFHYDNDYEVTGDNSVHQKVFCVVTVTPSRNFNLAEYIRHTVVENTYGTFLPGMNQTASEEMRKERKDMLHRVLLGQMDLCGFLGGALSGSSGGGVASSGGGGVGRNSSKMEVPDPLDTLNMPSTDYYPGNYLSVPMVYKRIQCHVRKLGLDHSKIYIEGFSNTVGMFMARDLVWVKDYNNSWASSFYEACAEFESLKPEERSNFCALLMDAYPPSWPRAEGEPDITTMMANTNLQNDEEAEEDDDDDVEEEEGGGGNSGNRRMRHGSGGVGSSPSRMMNKLYVEKNKIPPIKLCLRYNPLMYVSPACSRMEWEQQMGSLPAYFIYSMSRSIYSSASNPLLKPEYFMPEAKPMTTNLRWREHMNDGENPLAGFCVAGWASRQFERVIDATRQSVNVSDVEKVQMITDYMLTCFNMHMGMIDTKSLRSKTIFFAHKLMQEVDETTPHDLVKFFRDYMKIGTDTMMLAGGRAKSGKPLADGGYSQVSFLHCESLNILNRDYFHLNDLNLSLLFRMCTTTTHHAIGMHNDKISPMGSSIIACRGGGHYTGRWASSHSGGGGGSGPSSSLLSSAGNMNTNNGTANTYQALDKPNSVGGDLVVSHHAYFKGSAADNSSNIRTFDNGQVPADMTRFTEAGMRMFATVLLDERNNIKSEPPDNLFSAFYLTEMQVTNIDQVLEA